MPRTFFRPWRLLTASCVILLLWSALSTVSAPGRTEAARSASQNGAPGHAGKKGNSRPKPTPTPSIAISGRPKPREEWYKHCPPWGRGGDPEEDLLKNRIDPATHPHSFTAKEFLRLPWPSSVSRKTIPMSRWSAAERRKAFRYEGMAARLEGYLIAFDRLGPSESCNCWGKAGDDWHLWIGESYTSSRKRSIIAEATPRVRAREHGFDWKKFATVAGVAKKIRLTGWIFLDNDHQLDNTDRGTLWEIHPITRVDVWQKGRWVKVAG